MLGIMVALVNKAGGSAAFGAWAARRIKSRIGAAFATFVLGVLIFIDDYFNCLTVGTVMRPVTDGHRISRAKLAYIIDSTAAPVWHDRTHLLMGGGGPPPRRPSSTRESRASSSSSSRSRTTSTRCSPSPSSSSCASWALTTAPWPRSELKAYRDGTSARWRRQGNHQEARLAVGSARAHTRADRLLHRRHDVRGRLLGSERRGLRRPFRRPSATPMRRSPLPWGSLIALVFTFVYLLARRVVTFGEATDCIADGFKAMVPAMLVLTFALTLKLTTTALGAGRLRRPASWRVPPPGSTTCCPPSSSSWRWALPSQPARAGAPLAS